MATIDLIFKINGLEVCRSIPLRNSPAEVLRRVRLKCSPDPETEAAFQLVNEIEQEVGRSVLSGALRELLLKMDGR